MEFAGHFFRVLAQPIKGRVDLVFHPPFRVADWPERKALAQASETAVRAGFGLRA